jgi:hypothetical protein
MTMITLKEAVLNYEPKTTKNISDLGAFDINEPFEERTGTKKDGEEFKYSVLVRDGEEYRIPSSVLATLKSILVANAKYGKEVTTFAVECEGKGTQQAKYTVVTL